MTSLPQLAGGVAAAVAAVVLLPGAAFAAVTPTPIPVTPAPAAGPLTTPAPAAGPLTTPAPTTPLPTSPAPTAGQVGVVPVGPADTGGGSTAPDPSSTLLVLSGLGVAGAAGAATLIVARRRNA